ncbi:MAG: hypothetical protein Q9167_003415 [Letrouitia subvulpina]
MWDVFTSKTQIELTCTKQRIFLLKFAKPDHRQQLIIESGFRCHLTGFSRETAAAPSSFVAKLRKYLRSRPITAVSQVGTDRIIELQFSDGLYRLFLEFYAGGNIVLTDKELKVLALLRVVVASSKQEDLRVGSAYSLNDRKNYNDVPVLTKERVRGALERRLASSDGSLPQKEKQKKKKSEGSLRKALASSLSDFPPALIDHALHVLDFGSGITVEDVLKDESLMDRLMIVLELAQKVANEALSADSIKGYIVARRRTRPQDTTREESGDERPGESGQDQLQYEDFQPFRPWQAEEDPELHILEFDGYNKTVDKFFSSIESQQLTSRIMDREGNAKKKLEAARQEHENRIIGLQQTQELNIHKAQAIEANLEMVQEAIMTINGLVAQGMDWVEITRLIEAKQAEDNAVAKVIKLPLKLYENTATLLLPQEVFEEDPALDSSDSESENDQCDDSSSSTNPNPNSAKQIAVDVDLALSPWSNARLYYEQKKLTAVKEQKTHKSSTKALKSTEKKVNADLKKSLKQEKQVLRPVRRQLWFEKFFFFISSEGYLVLGNKDTQQSEILLKKYLCRGDVFVHADLDGAATVIIKNKLGKSSEPIPPSTLSQAGSFAVSTSNSWDSKAVMSAWWVDPKQVSKIDPTGKYLSAGKIFIQGSKNFLPPAHLLLGFGVMFQVSEESKLRHLKHRLQGDTSTANTPGHEDAGGDSGVQRKVEACNGLVHDSEPAKGNSSDSDHFARNKRLKQILENDEDDRESRAREPQCSLEPKDKSITPGDSADAQQNTGGVHSKVINVPDDAEEEGVNQTPNKENKPAPYLENATSPSGSHRTTPDKNDSTIEGAATDSMQQIEEIESIPRDEALSNFSKKDPVTVITEKSKIRSSSSQVRGKNSKHNRLKTKYANQDEDDRALALKLLGSATPQKKSNNETSKASNEQEAHIQRQRRQQQLAIAAEKGKQEEEIRRAQLEEGINTLSPEEGEALQELESFIGNPMPEDEVLDALVLCGPWEAIGPRCRWKAKLQPGATKRGKAVREILTTWVKLAGGEEVKKTPRGDEGSDAVTEEENTKRREGELVRAIREQDAVGVVPVAKCRVVAGADSAASKGKASGKGKRGGKGGKG